MNFGNNSQAVLDYLAIAWLPILAVAQAVKKYVPQIPEEYTGLFSAVLAFVVAVAVVFLNVPISRIQWGYTLLIVGFYTFSHVGAFETVFKGNTGSLFGFLADNNPPPPVEEKPIPKAPTEPVPNPVKESPKV